MLPRPHRLRRAADIHHVRRTGRRWRHPLVRLMVVANDQATSRFAVVAGRQVGKAVARNRSKRLLRESIRRYLPHIPAGWDCLFAANAAIAGADFAAVDAAVESLLQQAGLWQPHHSLPQV
jgi:ribonuclease P protein component